MDDHDALTHLRRESLDIYNRIHSIEEDISFVNMVIRCYPDLPAIPNLRCGAWYLNSRDSNYHGAYFKSTDGHFNNWSFNLRRPNLHILPIIIRKNGILIVDSTRAGKRMPDALSKTIPIWCTVVNRAVKVAYKKTDEQWDTSLYCPPGTVSAQESSQIEAKVDAWAASLLASSYILPDLCYPLRPMWITPATSTLPTLPRLGTKDQSGSFYPIICVSASKQAHEGMERRSNGFSYVQGSGDDHELWGMGLTPQLFWQNKDRLLNTHREELPDMIRNLVRENSLSVQDRDWDEGTLPTPISAINGQLSITSLSNLPRSLPSSHPGVAERIAYMLIAEDINSLPHKALDDEGKPRSDVLLLSMAEGKKGQNELIQSVLPKALPFVDAKLGAGYHVCLACHSGRDASVGVALAVIQRCFDDDGHCIPKSPTRDASIASKKSISKRLQWIIISRPEANPSRATLKRVNEFLLTPQEFRR